MNKNLIILIFLFVVNIVLSQQKDIRIKEIKKMYTETNSLISKKKECISGKIIQQQPGVPIKRRINTAANQGSIQSLSNAAIAYGVLTAVAIGGIIVATSNTNSSHSH